MRRQSGVARCYSVVAPTASAITVPVSGIAASAMIPAVIPTPIVVAAAAVIAVAIVAVGDTAPVSIAVAMTIAIPMTVAITVTVAIAVAVAYRIRRSAVVVARPVGMMHHVQRLTVVAVVRTTGRKVHVAEIDEDAHAIGMGSGCEAQTEQTSNSKCNGKHDGAHVEFLRVGRSARLDFCR